MKKIKFISLIVSLSVVVSLLTILNYDKIVKYFTNREWEIADSIGKIEIENYLDILGTSSNFFVVNGSGITGYSDSSKKVFEHSVSFKDVISDTAGEYAIIAEKNSTDVYVISKNEKIWNTTITNGNILGVVINKNGYSAVIYSQAGYKSLVKVFSNTGKELFTSYLASTYAIDVSISNDNKSLAIAEIDTNGVSLTSGVKLINIQNASENNVKKFDLDSNELISNIEYDDNNNLIIQTDLNIRIIKNNKISELVNFKNENIIMANIENRKNLVAIKIDDESLFNVKCCVCIYSYDQHELKKYEINETPNNVVTDNNIIAIDMGNKIVFLNTSGIFLKKSEYKGQLKDIRLFDDGKEAVLIFRDSAEFIKVGGV